MDRQARVHMALRASLPEPSPSIRTILRAGRYISFVLKKCFGVCGGWCRGGGGGISGWRGGAWTARACSLTHGWTGLVGRLGRLGCTWHYVYSFPSPTDHPDRATCGGAPSRLAAIRASSRSGAVRVLLGAVTHAPSLPLPLKQTKLILSLT